MYDLEGIIGFLSDPAIALVPQRVLLQYEATVWSQRTQGKRSHGLKILKLQMCCMIPGHELYRGRFCRDRGWLG
jgi:hypothetical protein